MKISVIIPVYNVEEFLEECLISVVNQTYKDLEIICVNDGSLDNGLKILEKYAKKDKRIKVISQENKGLSGARNTGIKNSEGELIAFVDSDDWLDLNYFEKLCEALTESGADIAAASILRTRKNSSKIRIKYTEKRVFSSLKEKLEALSIPKCCYVWNKLYRAEIVKSSPFREGVFYEDVFWTPNVVKKARSIITVPETNYYYRANSKSIVKKKQTKKHQIDSYNAKKHLINFYETNNLTLTKKQKTITKEQKYLFNIPVLKVKEFENTQSYLLFNLIPIFKKKIKTPIVKENTFFVWEPCSQSHSEVVPGFSKYLIDLGYHVSVLVEPNRIKEGLFSKFQNENLSLNKMTRKETKEFFKNSFLTNSKGVMVTTVGKICDCVHYDEAYRAFNPEVDKKKLLFVEHESCFAVDKNSWKENLITLRELNYKGAKSVVVNPHYFGEVKITPKNKEITNFISIGAIKPNKKNTQMIVNAAEKLVNSGYKNFKITVVGKGDIKHLPKELRPYFDIKGRLSFKKMYEELENADFMVTSYNDYDPEHIRYNTSGTSGNFQLVYGFLKPCIIIKSFAPINGFNRENSIMYENDEDFVNAFIKGIEMSESEYSNMQNKLKEYENELYQKSLQNLKELING